LIGYFEFKAETAPTALKDFKMLLWLVILLLVVF